MSESSENRPLVVMSSAPPDRAEGLARLLVEESLAACVQRISSVRSTYKWDDQVRDEEEVLLIIKTRAGLFEELSRRLAEWHPYDVPEIVALPASGANRPYLEWLIRETQGGGGEGTR